MSSLRLSAALLLLLSACATDSDSEGEDFLSSDANTSAIAEGSDEACAVLKLASLASFEALDKRVKINAQAARHLVDFRGGRDGFAGSDDDRRFHSLAQLDAVPFVGPRTLARMRAYVAADAAYACGEVAVQLLAINDYHGALEPPTGSGGKIKTDANVPATEVDAGGAEFLATHIKALRASNPNTLVVAAGDCMGATPLLSAAFHDEPTVESLNALGLDVTSVGNHEFDEGIEELWRMQWGGTHADAPDAVKGWDGDGYEGAAYTYLAANVTYDVDGLPVFAPFTVRRFGNAWVAFIGMTLEGTPDVVTASGVAGLSFRDEVDTANELVPEIQALGIETIVVLLHEGGAATGLYNECVGLSGPIFDIQSRLDPAIDIVVSGHTNAAHVCNLNGRLVTSAAHNGRLVSDIDLVIDERTGDVKTMTAANVIVTRTVEKNARQSEIIGKWKTLVAPITSRVVASLAGDITKAANLAGESSLGNVIADAQLAASAGARIAFMNPGGIRSDLLTSAIAASEQPNEVTYGELFSVQPFSNNLVLLDVTGADLERLLEEQWFDFAKSADRGVKAAVLQTSAGFAYTWDSTLPAGDRVRLEDITLDGQPIDAAATYRIVANVFLAGGGDGFFAMRNATNRVSGVFDLEALETYLRAHPRLAPPALDRIVRK